MSAFKKVNVTGGTSRQSILAPLRETQILSSKPVLPAGTVADCPTLDRFLTGVRDSLHHSRLPTSPRSIAVCSRVETNAGDGLRRHKMGAKTTIDGLLGRE